MALTPSTNPLVWIDCEMTGLDPNTDRILSISCYITDHELNLIDKKGYHTIVSTPKSVLDAMGEWCQRTHTANGLVEACLSSSAISAELASTQLLAVHADKMFLMQQPWAPVLKHLHYRILDVSAIKEATRRWCNDDVLTGVPMKKLTHSADEDIRESIEEARYYMGLFRGFNNAQGRGGQDARDGMKSAEGG
ncbi:Phosphatidylinositol 3,4,5-trisphosphate-dependent Rac exchanger 2 protein [Lithohypha guttulata]|uniref:Phosphatidylinositol 3,4,5-trisphosphate-dependent Rac exchanger 2 protein n=1 Tax=Lithohypha guttulata TaxID=1690604 RepID=A0AAN7SY25_9EURO|nr:Phosphatidylinositol 3,4,5-trisphosphate-dependent Rac exchanger 2 protein [Lithohypha guttulata]